MVVGVTIPGDSCPPTLDHFRRSDGRIGPILFGPAGGCTDPRIPETFVVALDWASTGGRFEVFLPGQPTYEFTDRVLVVDRSAHAVPGSGESDEPTTVRPRRAFD